MRSTLLLHPVSQKKKKNPRSEAKRLCGILPVPRVLSFGSFKDREIKRVLFVSGALLCRREVVAVDLFTKTCSEDHARPKGSLWEFKDAHNPWLQAGYNSGVERLIATVFILLLWVRHDIQGFPQIKILLSS